MKSISKPEKKKAMIKTTFETLPDRVDQVDQKLDHLITYLESFIQTKPEPANDWLDVKGLSDYLPENPASQTIYGWVWRREIPFHKGQKRLRFLRSEIDNWIRSGRKKTVSEIKAEIDLSTKKGGIQ